ncbi:DUF3244 domain-containing protein [Phocaeicola sp.]
MKNKLVLYLLVSLVASCIYPVTVWAKVDERFSLKNESVLEQIPLTKKVGNKTRSILIPPCSVVLLESSLIFSFHSLSEDAEIILYNSANSEMLRVSIFRYQRGSEINIPIDFGESGNYTLEVITASGEHWSGYFEYVASDTLSL